MEHVIKIKKTWSPGFSQKKGGWDRGSKGQGEKGRGREGHRERHTERFAVYRAQ